jgi:ubiquinone/menaquinone biosynthesis C-methylase UbiE
VGIVIAGGHKRIAGRTYDRMAPIYERLTDAYSLGCLPRAKRRQLSHFHAGMRVLYVGIGPGSDALAAAEKGAEVTGVDVSARMIELASASFASAGLRADLRHCDLFSFDPDLPYDVVVANFLLDCFHHLDRQRVVERLRCFLRTGGTVLISDTGSPRGSRLGRACWYSYHGVAYSVTWAQGITPWLPVMDLAAYLTDAGFMLEEHVFHRPRPRGPVLFESIIGVKKQRGEAAGPVASPRSEFARAETVTLQDGTTGDMGGLRLLRPRP